MVDEEVVAKAAGAPPVYVVWVPILDGDDRAAAEAAATRWPRSRVVHFWDQGGQLERALGAVLALPRGIAWDVYLTYDAGVRWSAGAAPPRPTRWMHQLGDLDPATAPTLDGALLRKWLADEPLSGAR